MLGGLGGGSVVIGGLVVGGLVIGGLDIGGLGVAAGGENTPEPEESKDSPNSGVASTGMSRGCAGVEPTSIMANVQRKIKIELAGQVYHTVLILV